MKKRSKYILPALTVAVAVLSVLSIVVFALRSRQNISDNNREYLKEHTKQTALLVDDSLERGLDNIQVLSRLVGSIITAPELDVALLQDAIGGDSVFDFIEFVDLEGKDHNITGGVSDAEDRQYYLDSMQGNSGVELIFNSRATNQTLLAFYSPVYYQKEMIGALVGLYEESSYLDRLLTMDVFGCKAEAYLCSEDGTIISSNQGVDTTREVSIETVLGPRVTGQLPAGPVRGGEQVILSLEDNRTGACVAGLAHNSWYIIQIFPGEASERMIDKANRIGLESAASTVTLLAVLLVLTYVILSRANRETQLALVKSEAANRAKSDFLFSMSHDLHTPINAIIGFLRLLEQRQGDPDQCGEYIYKIRSASELLLSIINNVLEMSKLEGGADILQESAWSAQQMVDIPCSLVARQMEEKQLTLKTAIDVQHPFVRCDRAKLQEIYLSLLNNACQYTPSGGTVTVRLTELPSDREGMACFQTEIEDTGIGIKKEFMPYLFEPFAREQDTTHSKVAGVGLGLPIVKRLTELMGGTVRVESEPGRGTKLTVTLYHPIASEDEVQDFQADMPVNLAGKRVLLAEDNELNAEIAMELLREVGLTVDWAQDGGACVAMVEQSEPYDLILMDIQMPKRNGYQAAEAIRALDDPVKARIPIVAMTANAFEEDRRNASAAGMDAHLAKPVDVSKLMELLGDILK